MHSTGRLLGLILWDVDNKKPGENFEKIENFNNFKNQIFQSTGNLGTSSNFHPDILNMSTFNQHKLDLVKHLKNSQEMFKLGTQLSNIPDRKNMTLSPFSIPPTKRKKLLNQKLNSAKQRNPDCRLIFPSDCIFINSDRKMNRLVTPEEYRRNRANSNNSDNSGDNQQQSNRGGGRGPFVPRHDWYREDNFVSPVGSGFSDPIRVEWSDKCPNSVADYNEFIDSNRRDVTDEIMTLELTSRTKLKNVTLTLEKVLYDFLPSIDPYHIHIQNSIFNRNPLFKYNLSGSTKFSTVANFNSQYGLSPNEVQFNNLEDKFTDDTRLETVTFNNMQSLMTFAASNLERIKCNTPFGFLLRTPALIDSISFPNNLVMVVCLPEKTKLIEMFEKVKAEYPYGCPLQSELIPEREKLENDYFLNFSDDRFKMLPKWWPFTTEMCNSSVQFYTSRFNASMTHYRPLPYQIRVLNHNVGLNIRGQIGNVLNRKGYHPGHSKISHFIDTGRSRDFYPLNSFYSMSKITQNKNENTNCTFKLMVSSLYWNYSQALRCFSFSLSLLLALSESSTILKTRLNPFCKYIRLNNQIEFYLNHQNRTIFRPILPFSLFYRIICHQLNIILNRSVILITIIRELLLIPIINMMDPKISISKISNNLGLPISWFNTLNSWTTGCILLYSGSFMSNNLSRVTGILDLPLFEFYQRLDKYEEDWFSLDAEDSLLRQWSVHSDMLTGTQFLATASKKVHERFLRLPPPTPDLPPMGHREHPSNLPDQNDPELIPKLMGQIGTLTRDIADLKKNEKLKVEKDQYNLDQANVSNNLVTLHSRQAKIVRSVGHTKVIAETALLGAKKAIATGEVQMALNLKQQEQNVDVEGYLSAMNIPKTVYLTGHLQLIKNLNSQLKQIETNPDHFIRSMCHLDNEPEPENLDKYIPVDLPLLQPPPSETTVQDESDLYYPNPDRLNEMLALNGPLKEFRPLAPISASGQNAIAGPANINDSLTSTPPTLPQPDFSPSAIDENDVDMKDLDDSESQLSDSEIFTTPQVKNIPVRNGRNRNRTSSGRSVTPSPPHKRNKKEPERKLPDDIKFAWIEFSKIPLDSCSDVLLEHMNVDCSINCSNPCFPELSKKQAKWFPISKHYHSTSSGKWPKFGQNPHIKTAAKIEQDFSDDTYLTYRYIMMFHLDLVLLNLTQIKQWPAPNNDIGPAKKAAFGRIQKEAKYMLSGPVNELAAALTNDCIMINVAESSEDDFKTKYLMPDISRDLLNQILKRVDKMGLNLPGAEIPIVQSLLRQLLSLRHPNLGQKYKDLAQVNIGPSSPGRSARIQGILSLSGATESGDAFSAVEASDPTAKETSGNDYFVLDGYELPDDMVKNMFLPPFPKRKPAFINFKERLEREDEIFDRLPVKTMSKINHSIVKARNRKLRIQRLQQIDHKIPLRVVSTNLNDPRKQLNHLIFRTNSPDLILVNELFLPETHILKRTFLNTDSYSFIYNPVTFRKKKYVFSMIMIKKSLDALVTKIPIAPPFASANVTLRLKNDQKVHFNIATFYIPHNPSKAQTMLNIKPAKHFCVLTKIFRKLFRIQSQVPSILTGDLNCDYKAPRDQDNKVFAYMIKRHTVKYKDLAGTETHMPLKRAPGQPVKPSRIDLCMVKGLKCKFKQTSGQYTAKNNGHVVFQMEFDLEPVFNDSKVRVKTYTKPTPEEIFEHSMVKYELAQFDLIQSREDCLRLIEKRQSEGIFDPITEPVPYISKIINLVDTVTNELTKQKEVFINRFNLINKMPPETTAVFNELNALIVKSSERILSGRERLKFRNLKLLLEKMAERDRQDFLVDYVHSKEGRVLTKKEQFQVNRRFNNKSKGEAFPETLKIDRITDLYKQQVEACKPTPGLKYRPICHFIRGKISRSHFNVDWPGNDKRFSLSAAARELQPLTLGYNSRVNKHVLSCYHFIYRKLFLDLLGFCLSLGYFPPEFKNTKIVPIPKQGQECIDHIAGRMQQIRFLGVSRSENQLVAKSVSPNISAALEELKILPDNQHAFRKIYSTSTCIGEIFNNINRAPKNRIVLLISFDIKKAFDSIPHEALGQRLDQICEPDIAQYLKDELRNRNYYVTYRGDSGEKIEGNEAGVIQGGCNSPAELAIMLADINSYFNFDKNNKRSLFADDVSMVCVGDTVPEATEDAIKQQAITIMDKMTKYLSGLGLDLNRGKTGILVIGKFKDRNFGTKNDPLKVKHIMKILGLRFKCNLFENDSFLPEIEHREERLGHFRACLTNIGDMGYLKFRKLLAFLFVYGILNYAFENIPIQAPEVYSRLNFKITRIIIDLWDFNPYTGIRHSYTKLFSEAGWMNARNTHYYNILNFANRILINHKPPSLYRELLSILKFSDGTLYATPYSNFKIDRERAELKFKQGLYPIVTYKHSVRSKKVFPYCLEQVFQEIPNFVLKHLGRDTFKTKIHYELKFRCQHAEGKNCSYCNIQTSRTADLLTISWNPHFITGYGSFSNETVEFNNERQIKLQSETRHIQHSHSQSVSDGSGQNLSVSHSKSASQPPNNRQSDSNYAISVYNAYHNTLLEKAALNPAKVIPYDDRFNF